MKTAGVLYGGFDRCLIELNAIQPSRIATSKIKNWKEKKRGGEEGKVGKGNKRKLPISSFSIYSVVEKNLEKLV